MSLLRKPPTLIALASLIINPWASAAPGDTNQGLTEASLAELTKPAKGLPFRTVIRATTGHEVIVFDPTKPAHVDLQERIMRAAAAAGGRLRRDGIVTARVNEAGNRVEPVVRAALKEEGLEVRVPVDAGGNARSTGYPDLEIGGPTPCYLELKTHSAATAQTTQRSFYYSPSTSPKIARDALHLLLSFELVKQTRQGQAVFVPVRWRLTTLHDLRVDLKFEFNQNNRGLYGNRDAILSEAEVK